MLPRTLRSIRPIDYLLLALPLAVAGSLLHWDPLLNFVLAALGLVPLASLIGAATEALAVDVGPRVGGLLNATLGNAAELIITVVAIRSGLLDLVKASITGSIIGNLLLVLGASVLAGGLKNGRQRFSRATAATSATSLFLAVLALAVPSVFNRTLVGSAQPPRVVEDISLGVAVVMIALYGLGLLYGLRHSDGDQAVVDAEGAGAPRWTPRQSLIVLAAATLAVVWLSEILVDEVEPVTRALGLSQFFIGLILIPIIGNAAEHMVALEVSLKNKIELSLEIALSSSQQIALFVAPVLVFVSLLFGHRLTLVFNTFELVALVAAVGISALVAFDGETNWLEGAQLIGVYFILAVAFFFVRG